MKERESPVDERESVRDRKKTSASPVLRRLQRRRSLVLTELPHGESRERLVGPEGEERRGEERRGEERGEQPDHR